MKIAKTLAKTLAAKAIETRFNQNKSIDGWAKELQLHPQTIRTIESGDFTKLRDRTAHLLAKAIGWPVPQLIQPPAKVAPNAESAIPVTPEPLVTLVKELEGRIRDLADTVAKNTRIYSGPERRKGPLDRRGAVNA